uniref:Uncharacterized protein n=1 Tax=Rhizophora mucronata TaxID=61149 RepID=A0A2P2PB87_RHIMU
MPFLPFLKSKKIRVITCCHRKNQLCRYTQLY